MRTSAALLLGAAFLLGCENRERHEVLAKAVEKPAAHLCKSWHKEGGGCYAECQVRTRAIEAHHSLLAAKELSRLPKLEDPKTEALLIGLRAAAAAVSDKLGDACSTPISSSAPLTDAARACAAAADAARSETATQRRLFAELARDVGERVGVELRDGLEGCGA